MMIDGQLYGRDVKLYADRPANVYEMLTAAAEKHPEKEAIIKDMTRLRYQDLKQQVDTVAANLLQEGINKGDRVALLLTNEVEFVLTALACAKMGAIFVPLNTRLTPDELTYMLTHSGAKLLVTQEKFALPLVDWMVGNEQLQSCLLIDSVDLSKGLGSFADVLLKEPEAEASFTPPEETDALYIMYTSGTTGLPKGAVGSHINVIHSSLSYQHVLKTSEQTRTLIAVPLFHVTGMIGQLFHMLLTGGTIVLMERYRTEPFIQTILEERISFLFNVPTIYVMIMNSPSLKEHSFDFVRTIAYGGAPMAEETIRELAIYFPNATFHNAYGATETSSPATIMPLNYPMEKVSSVGLPVPVGELKTVNSDGKECGPAEFGELYIKGPMVVQEYWNNPEANAKSFVDGYWKSGDIAFIDQDGFVYIMDRMKDIINRGGEKIYTVEVENVLYAHPKVLEASVVGIKDPLFGEEVKAFIVPMPGEEVTEEELAAFARKKLANYKVPRYFAFIDELPRNPGGKVLKKKLVELTVQ